MVQNDSLQIPLFLSSILEEPPLSPILTYTRLHEYDIHIHYVCAYMNTERGRQCYTHTHTHGMGLQYITTK